MRAKAAMLSIPPYCYQSGCVQTPTHFLVQWHPDGHENVLGFYCREHCRG